MRASRNQSLLLYAVLVITGWTGTARHLAAQDRADPIRLASVVDSVVRIGMREEYLPGAVVAVVDRGRIVLVRGYGVAEVATGRAMDADSTLVRIGSISKVFTSLALAKVTSRERVDLDAPVTPWLDGLTIGGRDYGEPVRFWHLLTHTSGFDQIGDDRQDADDEHRTPLRDFLNGQLILVRRPGEVSTYDTYGITLAGYLVEQLSGRPFRDYLQDEIFEPLAMRHTAVEAQGAERLRLALGYGFEDDTYLPQDYEYYKTTPASSIDATAADMARFMEAFLTDGANDQGRFLTPEETRRFKQPQFSNLPGFPAHAFGLWEDSIGGRRVLWHGGNMRGFTSLLVLVPADGRGLFVSINRNEEGGGPTPQLTERLKSALFELWYGDASRPHATAPGPPPSIDVTRFAGSYANTLYCHTCEEGKGWPVGQVFPVEAGDEPGVLRIGSSRLVAVDTNVFVSQQTGRRIGFRTDAEGHPRFLVLGAETFERLDSTLLARVFGPSWRDLPATTLEARIFAGTEQWAAASRAYAALGEQHPDNGRNWFYGGYAAIEAGDGDTAERLLRRAWEIEQWPSYTAYHLAEAAAIQGDAEDTITWLERAVSLHYPDLDRIRTNPRFEAVRDDPRVVRLLRIDE